MSVIEFEIKSNSMMKYLTNDDGDENLNHVSNKKQSRTTMVVDVCGSKSMIRLNSTLKSIGNDSIGHDNDLTNLNWLQDGDLLKKVYNESNEQDRMVNGKPQQHQQHSSSGSRRIPLRTTGPRQQRMLKHLQKPPFSYSLLIFMAIESSPTKSMIVSDIYKWIINHYPYFSVAPPGWKNTIRHTLSLRKCFKKNEINSGTGTKETSDIKRGYWFVDPEYRSIFQQQIVTFPGNNQMNRHLHHHHRHHYDPETIRTSIIVDRTRTQSLKLRKATIKQAGKISSTIISTNLVPILESYKYGNHHNHHHHNHRHVSSMMAKVNFNHHNNHGGYFLLNPTIISSLSDDNTGNQQQKIIKSVGSGTPSSSSPPLGNIYRNLVTVISVNQAPKLYAPVPIISMVKENNNDDVKHHNHQKHVADAGDAGGPINLSKSNKRNNGQSQQQPSSLSPPLHQESQKPRKYFNLLKDRQNVCSNCDYMATGSLMVLPTTTTTTITTLTTSSMLNNNNNHLDDDHNGNHYHVHQYRENGAQSKFKCNDGGGGGGQAMFGNFSINTNTNINSNIVLKNNNCSSNLISNIDDHQQRTLNNKSGNNDKIAKVTSSVGMKTTTSNSNNISTVTMANNTIKTMANQNRSNDIECRNNDDDDNDGDDDDGAQALLNFASKSFLFNIIN